MKLKSYILVGYVTSTLLTIIVVFWAVQKMLIAKSEIYFFAWDDHRCQSCRCWD